MIIKIIGTIFQVLGIASVILGGCLLDSDPMTIPVLMVVVGVLVAFLGTKIRGLVYEG